MEKKNVAIYVAGQRFSITTSDTEEYVIGIGEKVDLMIKGIAKDNPRLNRDACVILTALNFCDDETKLRQMLEVLREQVKDYIGSNEALRAENAKLKEELESLRSCAKADDVKAEESEEEAPAAVTSIPVPAKAEAIVAAEAQTRHTAFVGKDFKKNKKNKHKHQKNSFTQTQPAVSAPAAKAKESPSQADTIEDNSPYHQFSIFDDLM
ncbi:MAG: cell division protein ZapA [Ruminococcus sp.]|nr:cell division protein ZapA [Ruminococcus sp.]